MFSQAGLRFDRDFLNKVFFTGSGIMFQFFTTSGGASGTKYPHSTTMPAYKPTMIERLISWIISRIGKFALQKLFGVKYDSSSMQELDYQADLEVSPGEAANGIEKTVTYERNGRMKNLVVKVPPGVKPGTRIRLKHMGMTAGGESGDLYLHIKIRDQSRIG